jgi:hypothetical protein
MWIPMWMRRRRRRRRISGDQEIRSVILVLHFCGGVGTVGVITEILIT